MVDLAVTLSGTIDGTAEPTTIEIAGTLNDDGSMEGTLKGPRQRALDGGAVAGAHVKPLSRRAALNGLGATVAATRDGEAHCSTLRS